MDRRGPVLPAALPRPALALFAVALALFGVARTTGSGWLIVVLVGITTVTTLAVVLPPLGLRRVRVAVEAPRDATVGRPIEMVLALSAPSPRPLKVRTPGFDGGWSGAVAPCRGRVTVVPRHRGVIAEVAVDVRSAAPLGLVWWRRRFTVALARPIDVGPQPAEARPPVATDHDEGGREPGRTASSISDAVKTVREYHVGDPIKLVHWAATARAGELMVKELESPMAPALVLAVDLRGANAAAVEAAASRAAGLAIAGLRTRVPVVVLTAEATGPRTGPVSTPIEVGRRLARAVPGELPDPPRGVAPVVVSAREVTP